MHHNEQSRQQQRGRSSSGGGSKASAGSGRKTHAGDVGGGAQSGPRGYTPAESQSRRGDEDAGAQQKNRLQRRELDIPATPRPGGGRTEPNQPQLGGERNEEGVGNLISRDKTLMESPERGAASNRMPPMPEKRGRGISNRGDEGQSQVMKGRREQQTSGRGTETRPEHQPGATGRPANRRRAGEGGDLDTGNAGAMSGTNRSVKLTNKKRKNRAA
jgi:hypothetical protein